MSQFLQYKLCLLKLHIIPYYTIGKLVIIYMHPTNGVQLAIIQIKVLITRKTARDTLALRFGATTSLQVKQSLLMFHMVCVL